MSLLRNAITLSADPCMWGPYLHWVAGRVAGRAPAMKLPGGGPLVQFRSFSQFWSTRFLLGCGELGLLRLVCKPRTVLLDVGANVGVFAVTMGKLCSSASIFCFEPSPQTAEQLHRNIEANDLRNISVSQVAVSDSEGTILFSNNLDDPATNRIVPAASEISISVPMTTLDAFLLKEGIAEVTLAKVDVEGAEPLVLQGARQSLRNGVIKLGLVEICRGDLANFGFSVGDLFDAACVDGYTLHELRTDGTPGCRYSPNMFSSDAVLNAVLLR